MAGELNGTPTVLVNSSGEIMGQGDLTHTYGGTPIEIGNKSYGDWITYLDGDLATKQHIFSGDFTYNSDAQFRSVRADALAGVMDTYTLTVVGSGAVLDESFTGIFMPTGMSDTFGMGVKVTTTLAFNSSGPVTYVAATDV